MLTVGSQLNWSKSQDSYQVGLLMVTLGALFCIFRQIWCILKQVSLYDFIISRYLHLTQSIVAFTSLLDLEHNPNNCYKNLQDWEREEGGLNKERDNLWFMTLQLKFIFYLKRLKVKRSDGTPDIRSLPAGHI